MALKSTVEAGASKVFATVGTDAKVDYVQKLTQGNVQAFNYRKTNFEEKIKADAPEGIDLIVDFGEFAGPANGVLLKC